MKRTVILFVVLFAAAATAGDLAIITIDTQGKAAVATAVFDHAFTRSGQRFAVILEPNVIPALTAAGISYEIIMSNCEPEVTAVVYADRQKDNRRLLASGLAGAVGLDDGLTVAPVSSASAALIESGLGSKWRPLSELSVSFGYEAVAVPTAFSGPFPSDSVADLINADSLQAFDQRLEAFYTRHITRDSIMRARDWMVSKFHAWGYTDVTTPTFYYSSTLCYNVKVVKPGYAEPNQVIVIGGHYDSYNQQSSGSLFAPGSDDDGSGTALVLEIARALRNVPLRKTVIFMPFSAEEEGLVGSAAAASAFKSAGTSLECMMNYDMVAFTADNFWDIDVASGPNNSYMLAEIAAAQRVSTVTPVISSLGSSSDHYSFHVQGYPIIDNIESDFNTLGWHTNLDLTSRLNFPYYTQVTRMAAATLAQIAMSGLPTAISNVIDVGDGQSLEVHWNNCTPGYDYLVYWGTASHVYTDSVIVDGGTCSYTIPGLTDGVKYYMKAVQKPVDGYPSVYAVEWSETPYLIPRAPSGLAANPQTSSIVLNWTTNKEADIASYNVYRRAAGLGDFALIAQGITSPTYTDSTAVPQISFEYEVAAVDLTGHVSAPSVPSQSYLASFDGGVLIADEFSYENPTLPTQAHEVAWLDSLFDQTPFALQELDSSYQFFSKSLAARYSTVFWIDDDNFTKLLNNNVANWSWYLGYHTNALVAGYRTIPYWSSNTTVPNGHPLREAFKVSSWKVHGQPDWVGATGQNGWPTVELDVNRGPIELSNVPVLTGRPGTTVIYSYNSSVDWAGYEGQPCGIAYDGPEGKRVVLGFPLYDLTPASAKALVQKALQFFGETQVKQVNGDIDLDGSVDIGDLTRLIDYMFLSLTPLPVPSRADVDANCNVDIGDLTYLISNLFLLGPAPLAGCAP